jgi:hypothetical protein
MVGSGGQHRGWRLGLAIVLHMTIALSKSNRFIVSLLFH